MNDRISENFRFAEFEASQTADRLEIINAVTTAAVRDSIKALVLAVLQPLRTASGMVMHVNSGYRCPTLNAAVGGSPSSQHVLGEAADIATPDPYLLASRAEILDLPFDQMILYPTFIHFSHRLHGGQRHQILYNKSYDGRRL